MSKVVFIEDVSDNIYNHSYIYVSDEDWDISLQLQKEIDEPDNWQSYPVYELTEAGEKLYDYWKWCKRHNPQDCAFPWDVNRMKKMRDKELYDTLVSSSDYVIRAVEI